MKILITFRSPYLQPLGGANKATRSVSEALVAAGHSVQVVGLALDQPADSAVEGNDRFVLKGVEVIAVREERSLLAVTEAQIEQWRPDWVLVTTEDWGQGLLETALTAAPGRVVYLIYTPMALPFGPYALRPSAEGSRLIRQTAGIAGMSQFIRDYVRSHLAAGDEACPETEAIYLPMFGSGPFPRLGHFDNPFITLINPSPGKGTSIFLALAARFPALAFAAVPTWATTAADREALARLPNIRLLEPQADFDLILAQTRVLLMPSLWPEGFGNSAVEAMARGIPVLVGNAGAQPESALGIAPVLPVQPIVSYRPERDERGMPIPIVPEQRPQDVALWQSALARLVTDRAFYSQQADACRKAAFSFITGLSIKPLEDFLTRLQTPAEVSTPAKTAPAESSASDRLAGLSPAARALLMQRLRAEQRPEQAPAQRSDEAIRPRPASVASSLPLSYAQERIWLLDQVQPGNPAFNIATSYRLHGDLDDRALARSLQTIVQRHEVLRTTYDARNGQPEQIIAAHSSLTLPIVDLRHHPDPLPEMRRLCQEEAMRPFDLSQDAVLRACLLRMGDADHVLMLTLHHIAGDGWSMGRLWRELAQLYPAFCRGEVASLAVQSLPELPVQYADYALWERSLLQGERLNSQLRYWQERLAGMPAMGRVLTINQRQTGGPGQRGALQKRVATNDLLQSLNELSRRPTTKNGAGVTLFVTLLAAFETLLLAYTGKTDLMIGAPMGNRRRPEIQDMIGCFSNTVILRTDLSGNPTFRDLITRVQETTVGAMEHQSLPFQKLVGELRLPVDRATGSAFQIWFDMGKSSLKPDTMLPGLRVEWLASARETAVFDLALRIHPEADGLHIDAIYRSDLFESDVIAHMLDDYLILLAEVVAQPDARLSDLGRGLSFPASPAIERTPIAVAAPSRAILTPTEARVAAIWREALDANLIGANENFFDLGGHSLLAAQMLLRLRQEFANDVPLRRLFETPTIAGLAAYLDQEAGTAAVAFQHLLPIHTSGAQPPLFFLAGGGGGEHEYLTAYAGLIHALGHAQPFYGFQAQPGDGLELPFANVDDMAAAFVAEMRSIQPQGPYYLAGECIGAKVSLEMARKVSIQGEEVRLLVFLNGETVAPPVSTGPGHRLRSALRARLAELRRLPPDQRLVRLQTMAANTFRTAAPLTTEQQQAKARRRARLNYAALLSAHRPAPYDGDLVLLMTHDLRERGEAAAWRRIICGDLQLQTLVGVHRTYLGQHLAANAPVLAAVLASASSRNN